MTTDTVTAAYVDDLVIDEETGEVLEWPDELADAPGRIEYLVMLERRANAAYKAWEDYWRFIRRAIGAELERADLTRLATRHGTAAFRGRTNENVRLDAIPALVEEHELPQTAVEAALLGALKAVDPKKLREIAPECDWSQEAIDAVIERSESTWVQVSAARPEPPNIERKEVTRDE